jgi:hypothetical protein
MIDLNLWCYNNCFIIGTNIFWVFSVDYIRDARARRGTRRGVERGVRGGKEKQSQHSQGGLQWRRLGNNGLFWYSYVIM